jgi:hypothetical protein
LKVRLPQRFQMQYCLSVGEILVRSRISGTLWMHGGSRGGSRHKVSSNSRSSGLVESSNLGAVGAVRPDLVGREHHREREIPYRTAPWCTRLSGFRFASRNEGLGGCSKEQWISPFQNLTRQPKTGCQMLQKCVTSLRKNGTTRHTSTLQYNGSRKHASCKCPL